MDGSLVFLVHVYDISTTVLAHSTHTTHVMLLLTRPATSQGTQSHRKTCMLLNGYNEDQSQTTDTRRAGRALSSP